MKMRIITIALLVIFTCCLLSCSAGPNVNELQRRFESYTPDHNVVAILDDSVFYFSDHTLKLREIANGEDPNNGYLFIDGKLYFTTTKENGIFDFSLFVYSCDLYGSNKQLVFEQHGYKTRPWATGNQDKLYIEHYSTNATDASARMIDSFNVVTGAYQNEATGKTIHLADYEKASTGGYSGTFNKGILTIVAQRNNATYTVDPAAMLSDTFPDVLDDLECSFCGFYSADNGKIFLLYRIGSSGPRYPHLVCEYIPDNNELVFSLLYFADDITAFQIEHLGRQGASPLS